VSDTAPHAAPLKSTAIGQRILEIFRAHPDRLVSGEELSGSLAISRTAVWKQIGVLRELGYRIEARPSQGYHLLAAPDLFIPAEIASGLHTARVGCSMVSFRQVDSTNSIAFRMAEEGAADGTVVFADSQRSGKGRLGRTWESPPGVNLYGSVILRPPVLPTQAFHLTFLSAVAVARAIEATTPLVPTIKWPNDLLLGGRKVAGLLNEMSAETEKVNFVVLGIGVNLNMAREQFPADLRHPATSLLLEGGVAVDRTEFARALLTALDSLYGDYLHYGYDAVREAWLARCDTVGRQVRVDASGRVQTGIMEGIDDNGALLLRLPDGSREQVYAGDVSLV
jgi:BirA family biotin operon repressor/biotin-[acetyl-CoA-carboxylase] ligase